MAENKPQTDGAATAPKTPTRAEREATTAAVRDELKPGASADSVLDEAAEHMILAAARAEAGIPFAPPKAEDGDRKASKPSKASSVPARGPSGDPIAALARALGEHEQGEPTTFDKLNPPAPGQTERGWSPEVTARHPVVLAAVMAELAGEGVATAHEGPRAGFRDNYIDPTDRAALEAALSKIGSSEVHKDMLKQQAITVASDRLAAAQGRAARSSQYARAAMAEAIEEVRQAGHAVGHDL